MDLSAGWWSYVQYCGHKPKCEVDSVYFKKGAFVSLSDLQ